MSISRHQLATESQLRFKIDHTIRATVDDPRCIGTTSTRVASHFSC